MFLPSWRGLRCENSAPERLTRSFALPVHFHSRRQRPIYYLAALLASSALLWWSGVPGLAAQETGTKLQLSILPSTLIADGQTHDVVYFQLVDESGLPRIASQTVRVSLTTSDPKVARTPRAAEIDPGRSYGVTSLTTSFVPGSATVTAFSPTLGLASSEVETVNIPESTMPQSLAITFEPPILLPGGLPRGKLTVSLLDSAGRVVRAPEETEVVLNIVGDPDVGVDQNQRSPRRMVLEAAPRKMLAMGLPAGKLSIVLLDSDGRPYTNHDGMLVRLRSSNPRVAYVQSEATVLEGEDFALVDVFPKEAGSATLSALASGYVSDPIEVQVFDPVARGTGIVLTPTISTVTTRPVGAQQFMVQAVDDDGTPAVFPCATVVLSSSKPLRAKLSPEVNYPCARNAQLIAADLEVGDYIGTVLVSASASGLKPSTSEITVMDESGHAGEDNFEVVRIPRKVRIPRGSYSTTVDVEGLALGSATVSALSSGLVSTSESVLVSPPGESPSGLSISRPPINLRSPDGHDQRIAIQAVDDAGVPVRFPCSDVYLTSTAPSTLDVPLVTKFPCDQQAQYLAVSGNLGRVPGTAAVSAAIAGLHPSTMEFEVQGQAPSKLQAYLVPSKMLWSERSPGFLVLQVIGEDESPVAAHGGIKVEVYADGEASSREISIPDGESFTAVDVSGLGIVNNGNFLIESAEFSSIRLEPDIISLPLSVKGTAPAQSVFPGEQVLTEFRVFSDAMPVPGADLSWRVSNGNIVESAPITDSLGQGTAWLSSDSSGEMVVELSVKKEGYTVGTHRLVIPVVSPSEGKNESAKLLGVPVWVLTGVAFLGLAGYVMEKLAPPALRLRPRRFYRLIMRFLGIRKVRAQGPGIG